MRIAFKSIMSASNSSFFALISVESFMAATSLRLVMRSATRDITKAIAKR